MNFEWDDEKSEACFKQRGFDFAYSTHAFFDPQRLIVEDARHSYGEDRYKLMGLIDQRLFVVVYTKRRELIRIISARKANLREVKHYENSFNED